jgi:hypothetical protein
MASPSSQSSKAELDRIGLHYRLRFEQKRDYTFLLEYALRPSAWRMHWFKLLVRRHLVLFIHWCRERQISFSRIAAWLNRKGPKPLRGKTWHKSSVRYLGNLPSAPKNAPEIGVLLCFLKSLRGAWENRQPGLDKATLVANSPEERVRRIREFYEFLLPMARAYVPYLNECFHKHESVADRFQQKGTGMARKGEFALRYFGTPSFKAKGFVEVFTNGDSKQKQEIAAKLLGEEDIYPTKREVELLGRHKINQAVLEIVCRIEGLSVRTVVRYS